MNFFSQTPKGSSGNSGEGNLIGRVASAGNVKAGHDESGTTSKGSSMGAGPGQTEGGVMRRSNSLDSMHQL